MTGYFRYRTDHTAEAQAIISYDCFFFDNAKSFFFHSIKILYQPVICENNNKQVYFPSIFFSTQKHFISLQKSSNWEKLFLNFVSLIVLSILRYKQMIVLQVCSISCNQDCVCWLGRPICAPSYKGRLVYAWRP